MDGQNAQDQGEQSRVTINKKDPFRNFVIEVLGFNGINQIVALILSQTMMGRRYGIIFLCLRELSGK